MLNDGLNSVLGIELRVLSDNIFSCRSCVVLKKGNVIEIENQRISEGSLAKVLENLPKKMPVSLTLTGKGMIHRTVSAVKTTNDEVLVQAFPAVNKDEFYVQCFLERDIALVSIVRREPTDLLLDRLKRTGFKIYSLVLGASATAHIWPQLNIEKKNLHFDGHVFGFSEAQDFSSYRFDPAITCSETLKIEKESIDEKIISAYAGGFQLLMHNELTMTDADVASVKIAFDEFIATTKVNRIAFVFLGVLFISLLISFVLFSHYNAANARLAKQVGNLNSTADQAELMKKKSAENQLILHLMGWNGGYSYSFLTHEIGSSMPRQLQLRELTFSSATAEGQTSTLNIQGTTDNLIAVNNWILILKEKSWAKTVKLLKYQEEQESEHFQFSLLIEY